MASGPPAESGSSTTSNRLLTQDVQQLRKRTADDRYALEVPLKQARPSEPAGEASVVPHSDHRHQFTASLTTGHSAFPYQSFDTDGVRLSLDSGVHELSASCDQRNWSSDNYGSPPRADVNNATDAVSQRTQEEACRAARLSLDSGAQDLSGTSEQHHTSSNVVDARPRSDDVSDHTASDGNQAQHPDYKVLRSLLVNGVQGDASTSDPHNHSADSGSTQPSTCGSPVIASSHLGDAAQHADFTTFASPCPIVPKRDGPYKVYSRLQTMNNVKRYDVSVDELRRRASLPEGFNAAILNSYLRRSKAAENVRELRSELGANGLAVPNGRRHHKNLTAFSCLVEQEAKDLANDYDDLSKTFPYRPVGQKLARSLEGPHQLASVQAAIQLIEGSLLAISDAAKSEPQDQPVKHITKGAPKEGDLEDFSLLTHGFGFAAHRTAWTTLLQTLKAAASTLQQQMSSRMPPMMPMPSSTSEFAPPPWSMPPMSPFYPFMGHMPYGKR